MTPATSLTDARGVAVTPVPRGRIASLVPSLTDTVCTLGAAGRLVARTVYCVEPREMLVEVPDFGGTKNPDVDGILAAKPDVALVCLEENKPEHVEALEKGGVPVFAVMPRSLDDVAGMLRQFGALLGVQDRAGRALSDLTSARLAAGEFRRSLDGPVPAATLIWQNPWMAAGGQTHIDAVMAEVGLANVLADRPDYFEIELGDLAAKEPRLVLLPDEPFPFTHHSAWSVAAAGVVGDRRSAMLLDGKLLGWYGTRTARSLRMLVKLLGRRLARG
jgi:ABC-type Fe3+-hydroxamate transport system substrate-binding protein